MPLKAMVAPCTTPRTAPCSMHAVSGAPAQAALCADADAEKRIPMTKGSTAVVRDMGAPLSPVLKPKNDPRIPVLQVVAARFAWVGVDLMSVSGTMLPNADVQ